MLGAISALLLATPFVTASPTEQPRRSASVVQLPTRDPHGELFNHAHAKLELLRVRSKYSGKTYNSTASVNKRSTFSGESFDIQRRASSGKADLVDFYVDIDKVYLGPLQVGTPSITTTVNFDTSSSEFWLPLSSCKECQGPKFDTSSSSTYRASSSPYSFQYGGGFKVEGQLATDTVSVAGLSVSGQGFGAITHATGDILAVPSAGHLGLGFQENAQSGKTPFFINLVNNKALIENEFAFYMSRNGGSDSELCIGCVNSAKFSGTVKYYDLDTRKPLWMIPSGGFSYNGGASSGSFSAVIDSATTLIYIPSDAAAKLYAGIQDVEDASTTLGKGFYTFPCTSSLGTINLVLDSDSYAVNLADFNVGHVSQGSSRCVAGIVGVDINDGLAVLGIEFMKNWYSVFSYDKKAIGFAKAI